MQGFKQCSKGIHYYREDLKECPYCNGGISADINVTDRFPGEETGNVTQIMPTGSDNNKTEIIGEKKQQKQASKSNSKYNPISNPTVFIDEIEDESGRKIETIRRNNRRLVGWLVTYSLDNMGIDFKIYEGRNVVGHDADCGITVNDQTISGKHATILFRNEKYIIKDELSSLGTFVNNNDIGIGETAELQDGDIVKMGETIFMFRSSLY